MGPMQMLRVTAGVMTCLAALSTSLLAGGGPAAAASAPGVSASVVKLGIPYIDFASLTSLGVNLNEGNWPDAYKALIANINAHGGVDGRKLVPYFAAVNPTGSTAAATACTQLVEDDDVFVAIGPEQVNCYVNQYHIDAINGLMETSMPNSAANFTLIPPFQTYDPLQLSLFDKEGVFKGKKVGVFAGTLADDDELTAVKSELKKLHVDVVQSAVDSAPATDQAAEYENVQIIAQRFMSDGINEVVAVGTGSAVWPKAESGNQSTYNPSWIATQGEGVLGTIDTGGSNSVSPRYLKNMLASVPVPSYVQMWKNPAVQKCVAIVKKAYPSDAIATPTPTTPGSGETYEAVVQACQNLAMFTDIAAASGKHLTTESFTHAGYGLRDVSFPGLGGPVSFGHDQPAALGQVYKLYYDGSTNTLAISNTSLTK